jgi:hypothetical protein
LIARADNSIGFQNQNQREAYTGYGWFFISDFIIVVRLKIVASIETLYWQWFWPPLL